MLESRLKVGGDNRDIPPFRAEKKRFMIARRNGISTMIMGKLLDYIQQLNQIIRLSTALKLNEFSTISYIFKFILTLFRLRNPLQGILPTK